MRPSADLIELGRRAQLSTSLSLQTSSCSRHQTPLTSIARIAIRDWAEAPTSACCSAKRALRHGNKQEPTSPPRLLLTPHASPCQSVTSPRLWATALLLLPAAPPSGAQNLQHPPLRYVTRLPQDRRQSRQPRTARHDSPPSLEHRQVPAKAGCQEIRRRLEKWLHHRDQSLRGQTQRKHWATEMHYHSCSPRRSEHCEMGFRFLIETAMASSTAMT